MGKHTPGPWEVDVYGDVIANGEDVAHAVGHYGEDENIANARLMAAAPDMLSVCRIVSNLKQLGGMMPGTHAVVMLAVEEAERAIAKAEGQS